MTIMSPPLTPQDQLELLGRTSSDSDEYDAVDYEAQSLNKSANASVRTLQAHLPAPLYRLLPLKVKRYLIRRLGTCSSHASRPTQLRVGRSALRRPFFFLRCLVGLLFALIVLTGIFRPSYTNLPPHYRALRTRSLQSTENGRANPLKEQIFISVSLYDKGGHLANGTWGQAMLDLIELIGDDNVFISVYENDSGDEGTTALKAFESKLKCKHEIVSEMHVSKDDFPTITMPDRSEELKRLIYLSEMRNRALRPLDKASGVKYDKVLFMNDIDFRPIDAAQLLFSTNIGPDGRTQYLASCSLDFISPFKFYDVYATRDLDGYSMGVPFYPIFSNAGSAQSRSDILHQKDAVRVKSCWSGMVAVQAKYLQSSTHTVPKGFQGIGAHTISPQLPKKVSAPVRFRAEPEIFFDACECCLLLADVLQVAKSSAGEENFGIFVNPYVRVAYDPGTLWWLPITRRFERLFSWPHRIVNALAGMPTFNPHRTVEEGDDFEEEVWVPSSSLQSNGSWVMTKRTARNGLYCGVREMQLIHKSARKEDKNWENVPIPMGRRLD